MTADSLVYTDDDLQDDIFRALMAGEIAGVPAPAKIIETSLNRVFLAGDKAFKMKRAVRLSYVDFTADARDTLASALLSARCNCLDAPLAVRLDRIELRRGDASDADARVDSTQDVPRTLGPGWLRLDATMSPADLAAKVLEAGQ